MRLLFAFNGNRRELTADLEVCRREEYRIGFLVLDPVAAAPQDPALWTQVLYHPVEWSLKKHRTDHAAYVDAPFEVRLYTSPV